MNEVEILEERIKRLDETIRVNESRIAECKKIKVGLVKLLDKLLQEDFFHGTD